MGKFPSAYLVVSQPREKPFLHSLFGIPARLVCGEYTMGLMSGEAKLSRLVTSVSRLVCDSNDFTHYIGHHMDYRSHHGIYVWRIWIKQTGVCLCLCTRERLRD